MHNLSNLSKTVTHQSSTIRVCGFACELLSKNRDILSIPLYVYTSQPLSMWFHVLLQTYCKSKADGAFEDCLITQNFRPRLTFSLDRVEQCKYSFHSPLGFS